MRFFISLHFHIHIIDLSDIQQIQLADIDSFLILGKKKACLPSRRTADRHYYYEEKNLSRRLTMPLLFFLSSFPYDLLFFLFFLFLPLLCLPLLSSG